MQDLDLIQVDRGVVLDVARVDSVADGLADGVEGLQQVPDADLIHVHLGLGIGRQPVDEAGRAAEPLLVLLGGRIEQIGRVLELLVFEKLANQLGPWVGGLVLRYLLRRGLRQQHRRLDLHQRRGHDQKIARQVDVELFEHLDIPQILVRDLRQRDVVDIDLLLADQIQQKVQRAGEDLQVDTVISQGTLPSYLLAQDLMGLFGIVFERLEFDILHHGRAGVNVPDVLAHDDGPNAVVVQLLFGQLGLDVVLKSGHGDESLFHDQAPNPMALRASTRVFAATACARAAPSLSIFQTSPTLFSSSARFWR